MKVVECGTKDRRADKASQQLWHITEDKERTLCGYNKLYLFTDPIEWTGKCKYLCPDCFALAQYNEEVFYGERK